MEAIDSGGAPNPAVPASSIAVSIWTRLVAKTVVAPAVLALALITFWPGPAGPADICVECALEARTWSRLSALRDEAALVSLEGTGGGWSGSEELDEEIEAVAGVHGQARRRPRLCGRTCARFRRVERVVGGLFGE